MLFVSMTVNILEMNVSSKIPPFVLYIACDFRRRVEFSIVTSDGGFVINWLA